MIDDQELTVANINYRNISTLNNKQQLTQTPILNLVKLHVNMRVSALASHKIYPTHFSVTSAALPV